MLKFSGKKTVIIVIITTIILSLVFFQANLKKNLVTYWN